MDSFDVTTSLRLYQDELIDIKKILRKNRDIYFNQSHFIRCAIIKLINEHKKDKK